MAGSTPTPIFRKYPSIEACTSKSIARLLKKSHGTDDFVAMEKLHGCNFGFHLCLHDKTVRFQRREGFIAPDDTFFGVQTSSEIAALTLKMGELLKAVQRCQPRDDLVLFGELYGDRAIQKTIDYGPGLHFAAYDVAVDGVMLPWTEARQACSSADIPVAPLIMIQPGVVVFKLEGAQFIHVEDRASLMQHFVEGVALPPVHRRLAEGIVIRSLSAPWTIGNGQHQDRPTLKLKRVAFRENDAAEHKATEDATRATTDFIARAIGMVTPGRLASVKSKLLQGSPFKVIQAALVEEVILELGSDYAAQSEVIKKRIRKVLNKAAYDEVTAVGDD